jgi:uncharacterized protein (TIRG00374 family)
MQIVNRVLLLVGLGFLVYLIRSVGPEQLLSQVQALGWGIVPIILSEGFANLAHTVAWRQCIPGNSRRVPLLRLFRMAMAGFATNYLTPTASVGGDVTRATLLTSVAKTPEPISSALIDKLCMAVAHVLIAMFGSIFLLFHIKLPPQIWFLILTSLLLFAAGILAFLLLQKFGKLGAGLRWMGAHNRGGRWMQQASERITDVDNALQAFYRERPLALMLSIGWHLLGLAVAIFQAWLFLRLLHRPAPLNLVLVAAFLGLWLDLITFAVPMNVGALEGSRMFALKAIGLDAASGTAFGMPFALLKCFGRFSGSPITG